MFRFTGSKILLNWILKFIIKRKSWLECLLKYIADQLNILKIIVVSVIFVEVVTDVVSDDLVVGFFCSAKRIVLIGCCLSFVKVSFDNIALDLLPKKYLDILHVISLLVIATILVVLEIVKFFCR